MSIQSKSSTLCAASTTVAYFEISGAADTNMAWIYNAGPDIAHYRTAADTGTPALKYDGSTPPVGDSIIPPLSLKAVSFPKNHSFFSWICDSGTATLHVEPFSEVVR